MVKIVAIDKTSKKEEKPFDYQTYANSFSNIDSFAKLIGVSLVILLLLTTVITQTNIINFNSTASPEITINSPGNNSVILPNATITLMATSTDTKNVQKVEFLVNGQIVCKVDNQPYACDWTLSNEPNRSYIIESRFYDLQNHTFGKTIQIKSGDR